MATAVRLNRCTWEQSTFKLPPLRMPLTINATAVQEGDLSPCPPRHWVSAQSPWCEVERTGPHAWHFSALLQPHAKPFS